MIRLILARNRQVFSGYTQFRKEVFLELAPKAGEAVLYLLPWLLSINHESCPGFIPDLERPFKVFDVESSEEIKRREPSFKKIFGVREPRPLLQTGSSFLTIQGLYTIGSVGSVSQTSISDCDIWVSFDKRDYSETAWRHLHQKINLIKDWLDMNLKMQVFFFVSDVGDVRNNHFGSVNEESSGSTQKNLLKEEFYRTCIVICGKIPLWWLCYDADQRTAVSYEEALNEIARLKYGYTDIVDFGDLSHVEKSEHFGAALWQLQKSLSSPLKSIIKMIHVKLLLESTQEIPICHQFREAILTRKEQEPFPDPSVFTMSAILEHYKAPENRNTQKLLKECFYLRCDVKPQNNLTPLKNSLIKEYIRQNPIDVGKRLRLSRFGDWDFNAQINLGDRLFRLLLKSYRDISSSHTATASKINKQDFTIIGRKILASYQKKDNKVRVLQKPVWNLNIPFLTLQLKGSQWQLSSDNRGLPLAAHTDILRIIAFIVWNGLFEAKKIRMEPNPSSVTLQEVLNLGRKIQEFFGIFDRFDVELSSYLKKDRILKIMVAVSFEKAYYEKDINDFGVIFINSWGELFVERIHSPRKLEAFIKKTREGRWQPEINYYVQRNSTYYEKIIERTKRIIFSTLESAAVNGESGS
jgi:adenylate cyclase, class 1